MEGGCGSVSYGVSVRGDREATPDSIMAVLEMLDLVNSFPLGTTRSSSHFWFFIVISKDGDHRI